MNQNEDRITTIDDEKKRALDLWDTNLPVLSVGIFDEPTRCYKINKEWAAIVMGMVSWLAEIAAWKQAQNETYPPIQEIMKFLEGSECEVPTIFRQNPTNSCLLEQSSDGGLTWSLAFDYSLCIPTWATTLQQTINDVDQNVTTIINNEYNPANLTVVYETTTINNYANTPPLDADMGGYVGDDCSTVATKDEIYGGVSNLVDYILQKNADFLEKVGQVGGNAANLASMLISGIPIVGLAPIDELVGYAGFLIDELAQEYKAALDTDLIQQIKCDLYCLVVDSDCSLSLRDICDYFESGLPSGLGLYTMTVQNAFQFVLTGTMNDHDYVYYLCAFQLLLVFLDQNLFEVTSERQYELQFLAGVNSPDNDWSLFCTTCPSYLKHYTHDFSSGLGDWTITNGTQGAGGIEGEDINAQNNRLEVRMIIASDVTIRAVRLTYSQTGGIGNGSYDWHRVGLFADDFTDSESLILSGSFVLPGDDKVYCAPHAGVAGQAFRILCNVGRHPGTAPHLVTLHKIEFWTELPSGIGKLTTDALPC